MDGEDTPAVRKEEATFDTEMPHTAQKLRLPVDKRKPDRTNTWGAEKNKHSNAKHYSNRDRNQAKK
jgi:hypothetical protein